MRIIIPRFRFKLLIDQHEMTFVLGRFGFISSNANYLLVAHGDYRLGEGLFTCWYQAPRGEWILGMGGYSRKPAIEFYSYR